MKAKTRFTGFLKAVLMLLFIGSMIAGTKLYAQDDKDGRKPPPEGMMKHTPEEIADHMSKMLEDKLSLSSDQKTQVHDIVLNYVKDHDRSTFDHKELDRKIAEVLTQEQKDKFREFIKNRPEKDGPPKDGPPRDGEFKEGPPEKF
jgi:Spy/CpxP family protein refolding chaperone